MDVEADFKKVAVVSGFAISAIVTQVHVAVVSEQRVLLQIYEQYMKCLSRPNGENGNAAAAEDPILVKTCIVKTMYGLGPANWI